MMMLTCPLLNPTTRFKRRSRSDNQSYAEYIPSLYICAATRLALHQSNTIYQFAFDVACLCLMLVYLMRMHRGGSLWTLLVQQVRGQSRRHA